MPRGMRGSSASVAADVGAMRRRPPPGYNQDTMTSPASSDPADGDARADAAFTFDYLVLGSGIAGLTFALKVAALGTVAVGEFVWGRRDGRIRDLADGVRDWMVVAAVVSLFWWVTLSYFEGTDDIVTRLSDQFLSVVLTAVVLFAPALVGLLLGRDSRGA